jgi:dynein heavy chain
MITALMPHMYCVSCIDQPGAVCRESETDTVFEYLVNDASGSWQHWAGCVPEWTYPYAEEKPKFAQLVIPTLDSVR